MRVFLNVLEADSEIDRDLSKAPVVSSSRVQGSATLAGEDLKAHEIMAYTYSILTPPSLEETVSLLQVRGYSAHKARAWLLEEMEDRCLGFSEGVSKEVSPDLLHDSLSKIDDLNYRYSQRLANQLTGVLNEFLADPYNRRMYVPIFEKDDTGSGKRIPCSLGYQFMLRENLNIIYNQRSCDFGRFWISDVYFAFALLKFTSRILEAPLGMLVHFVSSFHRFTNVSREVY